MAVTALETLEKRKATTTSKPHGHGWPLEDDALKWLIELLEGTKMLTWILVGIIIWLLLF
jgi:hypothetical protein